jgi:hypothetical protein
VVVSVGVLSAFSAVSVVPVFKKHPKLSASIIIIISFVSSLLLWLLVDEVTGLSFYFLNITYLFIVTIIRSTSSLEKLARQLDIANMGAFVLVTIVVLIIFTEGDVVANLELVGEDFRGEKKTIT